MRISEQDQIAYADKIMAAITDDMIGGIMDVTADSFQDLHDSVDANQYMIDLEIPWDFKDVELSNDNVAIQEIVDKRLRAGRPTLVEGLQGGDVASLDWGVTWYVIATDENDEGTVEVDGGELLQADPHAIALVRRMCEQDELEEGDRFSVDSGVTWLYFHSIDLDANTVTVGEPGSEPSVIPADNAHLVWVIRKDPEN